jgi:hypothetical protein
MRRRPTPNPRGRDRRHPRRDHGRTQHGRVVSATRSRRRARQHRPNNGRHHETGEREPGDHHHRPPPELRRAHPRDPHPRHPHPRDPHPRHPHPHPRKMRSRQPPPPHPNPSTHRRLRHRLDSPRPRHRVVHRPRLLPPEVLRSDRRRLSNAGLILDPGPRLRDPRTEGHQLVARTEPIPGEVDDVGRRLDFLVPCWGIGSVVFHRFAELFWLAARSCVLPSGKGVWRNVWRNSQSGDGARSTCLNLSSERGLHSRELSRTLVYASDAKPLLSRLFPTAPCAECKHANVVTVRGDTRSGRQQP